MEVRIKNFERMLADKPTALLTLPNEYRKADRREDEVTEEAFKLELV